MISFHIKKILLCFFSLFFTDIMPSTKYPMYFVAASDEQHFPLLLQLIGSIHKIHFNDLGEIAIFDLGFTATQRNKLLRIKKVKVYDVELTHPDLIKHFKVRPDGRTARGWYAWKPVVIKQALDMFPYILYIDSGILIKNNLTDLFEHIRQNGYFFHTCWHSIAWMTTKRVIAHFNLTSPEKQYILDSKTYGISAGFQGLTRAMYDNYVLPMYEHSKNIDLFADDGTTPDGFGTGRHDQTLFSIYVSLLGLKVSGNTRGDQMFFLNEKSIPFRLDDLIQWKVIKNRPTTHESNSYIYYK